MARPTGPRPPGQSSGRTQGHRLLADRGARQRQLPRRSWGTAHRIRGSGNGAILAGIFAKCWVCKKGQCQSCDRDWGLVSLETTKARDMQVLLGRPFPGLCAWAGKRGSPSVTEPLRSCCDTWQLQSVPGRSLSCVLCSWPSVSRSSRDRYVHV